jgi:VWFA-related protein
LPMNRRIFPRAGIVVSLAFAAGVGDRAAAQAPQNPQSPPAVTFQTEVNYVDVDAIVTDQQGNFVSGLSKEDFEIFEDGRPQKIDTFAPVDLPVERPDRFLVANRPVTTDVRSNRQAFAGRVYVIVLDDLDVSFMRSALVRKAAHEFVERYFGANDMAAVTYTSGRTDATQEFTGNPQLLLAAIDKFAGRRLRSPVLEYIDQLYQNQAMTAGMTDTSPSSDPASPIGSAASITQNAQASMATDDLERQFRATNVLGTIRNLAEFLSNVRGRRKALLLFSEGIDYTINDVFGIPKDTTIVRATQDAISAAARANVNFFTIDPRGLVGMTDDYLNLADGLGIAGNPTEPVGDPQMSFNGRQAFLDELRLSQDSLRTLADETGGFAAINRNSFTSAFDRIVQANSRYYVMGYYPPSHPRDGKFHKIQVRVKRPGLTVSARKGYASPRGKTPEEKQRDDDARRLRDSRKGGADNTSAPLREALNTPMQQGGVTFSVQAAPFKGSEKAASVALAIEIDGDALHFAPPSKNATFSDSVELSLFAVNEQGKPQQGTRSEVNLTLRPDTYQRVKVVGMRLNPRVALAPGRYQMRLGVRESGAGALGSVFYDLVVPDFSKDPLMMSGLLVTAFSAQVTPTPQPDPVVAKMLPWPATSRREFAQSDTLSVLAEIYDNISSQQPRQIDTGVRLMDESGRDVFAARDSFQNGSARNWSVYGYTHDIELKAIAPGRYLLRVEAQVRGNTNGAKPVGSETLITVVKSAL